MCLHANDVYIVPAVDVYYLIKEGGDGQGGGGGGRGGLARGWRGREGVSILLGPGNNCHTAGAGAKPRHTRRMGRRSWNKRREYRDQNRN